MFAALLGILLVLLAFLALEGALICTEGLTHTQRQDNKEVSDGL